MMNNTESATAPTVNPKQFDRKLINYLVRPRAQFKHALFAMFYSFLGIILVQIFSYYKFATMELSGEMGSTSSLWFSDYVQFMFFVHLFVLFVVGLVSVLLSIVTTHHFVGPIIPIVRHIEALRSGNYKHKSTLRKKDELFEITEALNNLSDSLNEKHPQP